MKRDAFVEDKPIDKGLVPKGIEGLVAGDRVTVIFDRPDYHHEDEGVILMTSQDSIAVSRGGASILYFNKRGEEIVFDNLETKHRIEPA